MDYEDDNPTSNDDDINTLLSTSSYDDDITHGVSEKLQSKIIHPINVIHSIICGKISNEEWNESIHSIHHQQTQEIANTFAECKQFFQAFQKQSTEFNQLIEETKKSSDENNDDISVILKNILKSDSNDLQEKIINFISEFFQTYSIEKFFKAESVLSKLLELIQHEFKQASKEIQSIIDENMNFMDKNEELTGKLESYETTMASDNNYQKIKELEQKLIEYKSKADEYDMIKEELSLKNSELESQEDRINELEDTLQHLSLTTPSEELQLKVKSLEAKIQEFQNNPKVNELREIVSQKENENQDLKNQINDLKKQINNDSQMRQQQMDEKQRLISKLQTSNDNLLKKVEKKEKENEELEEENESIKLQLDKFRSRPNDTIDSLHEQLSVAKQEIESQEKRIFELENGENANMEKLKQRIDVLNRICARILNEKNVSIFSEDELNKSIDSLQTQINDLVTKNSQLYNDNNKLKNSVLALKSVNKSMNSSDPNSKLLSQFEHFQNHINSLEESVSQKDKEIIQLKKTNNTLEKKNHHFEEKIEKLQGQVLSLSQKDKEYTNTIRILELQKEAIQSKNEDSNAPSPRTNKLFSSSLPRRVVSPRRSSERFVKFPTLDVPLEFSEILQPTTEEFEKLKLENEQLKQLLKNDVNNNNFKESEDEQLEIAVNYIEEALEINDMSESKGSIEHRISNLSKKISSMIQESSKNDNNNNDDNDNTSSEPKSILKGSLSLCLDLKKIQALQSISNALEMASHDKATAAKKLINLTGDSYADSILAQIETKSNSQSLLSDNAIQVIYQHLAHSFHMDKKIKNGKNNCFSSHITIAKLSKIIAMIRREREKGADPYNELDEKYEKLKKHYKKLKSLFLTKRADDKNASKALISLCPTLYNIERVRNNKTQLSEVVSLFLSEFPATMMNTLKKCAEKNFRLVGLKLAQLEDKITHITSIAKVGSSHFADVNHVNKATLYNGFDETLKALFPPSARVSPAISKQRLSRLLTKITITLRAALKAIPKTTIPNPESIYDYSIALRSGLITFLAANGADRQQIESLDKRQSSLFESSDSPQKKPFIQTPTDEIITPETYQKKINSNHEELKYDKAKISTQFSDILKVDPDQVSIGSTNIEELISEIGNK